MTNQTDHPDPAAEEDDLEPLTSVRIEGLWERPSIMDTIVQFVGYDNATGQLVRVAADHRPARDLIEILCDDGEVEVRCEAWQVHTLPANWLDTHEIIKPTSF